MKNKKKDLNKHLSNKSNKFSWFIVGIVVILLIAGATIFFNREGMDKTSNGNQITELVNKIENPEEYTWEEYQALTAEEKMLFPDGFEDMDAYNKWYDSVQPTNELNVPTVDLGGKEANELTWDEYQKLSVEEKAVFPDCFESFEKYQEWYDKVSP